MARPMTTAAAAALAARVKRPVLLFEVELATGWVRLWSGVGAVQWSGHTWLGTGPLGRLSGMTEVAEVEARGMTAALSGVDPEGLAMVLAEVKRGRPARTWLGFLDESGVVIGDPVLLFEGRTDAIEISDEVEAATISLGIESGHVGLRNPRIHRLTDQDQQRRHPGDRGLEFVPRCVEWSGKWG